MFAKLKALFEDPGESGPTCDLHLAPEDRRVAVAALMVEAALMDEVFDEHERAVISKLIKSHYDLNREQTDKLLAYAEQLVDESNQLYGFTRVVKDRLSIEERIDLMEMLWQVVYSDGGLDDYEANLMRRIAGLIYVEDQDNGKARKRALARLGLPL